MDGRCIRHGFELAEARCRACGSEYCNECLVYSFGPGKPPFCVPCALAAAGVRSNSGFKPNVDRKELRRMEKEQRKAAKVARKQGKDAPEPVAAPAATLPTPPVSWEPEPEPVMDEDDNPFAWADKHDDRVSF